MMTQTPKDSSHASYSDVLTGLAVLFSCLALTPPLLFTTPPADAAQVVVDAGGTFLVDAPLPTGSTFQFAHPADLGPVNPPEPDVSESCPSGWTDVGRFKLTAYVLAVEEEFDEDRRIQDPCGLSGSYRTNFLFSTKANPGGVMMQGSGRTVDGRIVHYLELDGRHCFEELSCPKTASGTCAEAGRTVAVDRRIVPLGADLLIEGVGARVAEDTGSRVRGRHIDLYRGDELTLVAAQRETRFGRRVCYRRVAKTASR
jgi:3D (Asp-Asp-Asp) domain-containing protein